MKIIKIKVCKVCPYYNSFTVLKHSRHICRHSEANKKWRYRIIDKKIINKNDIPDWCPLENYKKEI